MIMLHVNARGTTFEYQHAPNGTTFSFCFLTVNQDSNQHQQVTWPGNEEYINFLAARGQILVTSGDRAPLEHSLVFYLGLEINAFFKM